MSACNVWCGRDRVHLMTDGAGYRLDTGDVVSIRSKVTELPNSRSAFATLGTVGPHLEWLEKRFARSQSFDELITWAGHHAREGHEMARERITFEDGHVLEFELTFIGWSDDSGQAEAWSLMSHSEPAHDPWENYEPFVPARIFPALLRPGVGSSAEAAVVLGLEKEWRTPDEFYAVDVEQAALALLEAQRALKLPLPNGLEAHQVGGFIELTTASKSGITRQVLKEWPDQVGQLIQPLAMTDARDFSPVIPAHDPLIFNEQSPPSPRPSVGKYSCSIS